MKVLILCFLASMPLQAMSLSCKGVKDCVKSYSGESKVNHQIMTRFREIEKLSLKVEGDETKVEEAFTMFLNSNGLTRVKYGSGVYYIVDSRDIRYTATNTYSEEQVNQVPKTFDYFMVKFDLKKIDSTELTRSFRPFMSRYGRIIDIKKQNSILIQDTGVNIHRLAKMVKSIDL